ncbi:hypothetical protein COT75_00305 [Candidatus Beckwithbacteria bacterium CG10_big_fil_rev_8_21_14_0_10_34_10]|uniref:Uncharacterized protein n=1 Tax=Candidatus Beckwithbacteria bacterium CG10_big_fil_rev_8_21_14_0_10_34_10 TaxID=1974495 RepID=A0A2H0WAE4_9BACT|nr:MAG: hypothetical protein COT75_00305 [Candidatus Beckwithbacteria bacterium CG10_big_fil_rev_8_21_14_0_10_34_10]
MLYHFGHTLIISYNKKRGERKISQEGKEWREYTLTKTPSQHEWLEEISDGRDVSEQKNTSQPDENSSFDWNNYGTVSSKPTKWNN